MKRIVSRHRLKPYEFQHKAYDFIHYHGAVYLMLDMGMGKTRVCIEVGRTIEVPMFILAPRYAALETWPDEFRKWAPGEKFAVLHGPDKERIWANSDKYTNIILTYDGLKWFYETANKKLRPLQKYMFVFDEASMVKSSTSIRWQILHDMSPIMSPYKVALSGTPTPKSLEDLWSQYFLLDGGRALSPEYYMFRSRFFDHDHVRFKTTLKPGAEEKIFKAVAPITMRLAAEDYLELPELKFNAIRITLPSGLRRQYTKLEEDFMLEFPDSTAIANSAAVRDHKLRQFLQGAIYATDLSTEGSRHRLDRVTEVIHNEKLKVLKQLLDASAGRPMLVAIQFKFEHALIEKALGKRIPLIAGATSGAEGQHHIQRWNRGELPVLVVHPKSVAYSLNLQSGGSDIVFMALPWELDLYQQLIKRLHRQGQKSNRVMVHSIAFKNTVEDKVAEYLNIKDATQEGLFKAVTR